MTTTRRAHFFLRAFRCWSLLIFWPAIFCSTGFSDTLVPDNDLARAIRSQLGISTQLTVSDLENLEELELSDHDIYSLEGLQYAINLKRLSLRFTPLSDLSPLSRLPRLEYFYAQWCTVGNLSALSGIVSLKELRLYDVGASHPETLGSLVNLEKLSIFDNTGASRLTDIGFLATLPNLKELMLRGNLIADLSVFGNSGSFENLESLNLQENTLADLSPLAALSSLKELTLYGNLISDVTPLASLTGLEALDLRNNQISDISALVSLLHLKFLGLSDNQVSDASLLGSLASLGNLEIDGNSLTNLEFVSSLSNLRSLNASRNAISDISPLSVLTNLTELQLGYNRIRDVSPIQNLPVIYARFEYNLLDVSEGSGQRILLESKGAYFRPQSWFAHFSAIEASDPLITDFSADPDHDSIPNWLEYIYNLDPHVPSEVPVFSPQMFETYYFDAAALSFQVGTFLGARMKLSREALADPRFGVELQASSNLVDWETLWIPGSVFNGTPYTDGGIIISEPDGLETNTILDSKPISQSEKRFLRLICRTIDPE